MFRSEPAAELRVAETKHPDPRHPGIELIERTYLLATGSGDAAVEIARDSGAAIVAGQSRRPQPIGRIGDRYWWLFRDRVYSTPDRLSRAAVLRLVERERRAPASRAPLTRGDHATA